MIATVALAAAPAMPAGAPAPAVRVAVDWPAFLSRHDLIWRRMPQGWGESAFLGNGLLGATISGIENGRYLRWHVGRTDVGTGGQGAFNDRLPIGDLVLITVGQPRAFQMRLDLWNAEVSGELQTAGGSVRFRSFTAAEPLVQAIEIVTAGEEQAARFNWEPAPALSTRLLRRHEPILDGDRNPPPSLDAGGPVAVSTQPLGGGGEHATAWLERRLGDGRRLLLLSVGFSRGERGAGRQQAVEAVARADEAGLDALARDHRAWWHAYWPKSFVSIPDTRLESFYWIQMYKLASATRADRPAIDLLGPWFDPTPWPRIWWNLNLQLTYWPVLASNRVELGESLTRMLDACAPALAENAGRWSADSATIGRTSGHDCRSPGGQELCNLPWAMHNYWLQYRYTMDDGMLRERLLPLLRRSIRYYVHLLEEGADGRLHLPRGLSPEYDRRGDHRDTQIDLALLRWGCQAILDAGRRLGVRDPDEREWRRVLERLAPFPTDEHGLRISADTPYALSHRHYSHLLAIYPLYLLRWDRPADRELIARSFDHWMSLPERFRGYSWTGAASIAASIGRPDDAARYLNELLEQKAFPILPNTQYAEAGPVIETPLSGAAALHDLLLQSWGGTIRVFPGVPAAWRDVTIHEMRSEGAFLVSAARRDGRTRFVRIHSLAGEPCRVAPGIASPRALPPLRMRNVGDGIVELALARGQSVVLVPAGEAGEPVIEPVAAQPGRQNLFGLP